MTTTPKARTDTTPEGGPDYDRHAFKSMLAAYASAYKSGDYEGAAHARDAVIDMFDADRAARTEATPVYLIATGETHGGRETYTRHDAPVPLVDQERVRLAPTPAVMPAHSTAEPVEAMIAARWPQFRNEGETEREYGRRCFDLGRECATPPSADIVRRKALEEAAREAASHYIPGHSIAGPHFTNAIADAIRALAAQPATPEPAEPSAFERRAVGDISSLQLVDALTAEPSAQGVINEIAAERQRQISVEGWTFEHDDEHEDGSMACAAGCYALASALPPSDHKPEPWPWARDWWKPGAPRRMLIKAGALIVAEIERLDRATAPSTRNRSDL